MLTSMSCGLLLAEGKHWDGWLGFSHFLTCGLHEQVMWNAAVHMEFVHDHADYGFETPSIKFNWR